MAEETNINFSTKNIIRFALFIAFVGWMLVLSKAEALQYFKLSEFTDREPPYAVMMDHDFLQLLDELRRRCGFPIYIKSGYRSPYNSNEKDKDKPGTHTKGIAVDIIVNDPQQRATILRHAYELGFTGIGIYPLHIHLDTRETKRVIWIRDSYNVNQARDSPNGKTKMTIEAKNETQVEEQEKPVVKKDKQVFHRAIKRDYQRQDFYQKTR